MTISIVTFAGNSGSSGGGLYNAASGSGTVTNATFNLNKASTGSGGGVYNAGQLNFTNATIAQNSAVPAAASITRSGSLTAINATIAQNTPAPRATAAASTSPGGSVAIYNTIVASNVRGSTTADDIFPLAAGTRLASTAPTTCSVPAPTASSPTARTAIRSASPIRTWAHSPITAGRSRPSPC